MVRPRARTTTGLRGKRPAGTTGHHTADRTDASDSKRIARANAMRDVLLEALGNPVSLAHVHCLVAQRHPSVSDSELQHETIGAMRYLVRAGLVNVGYRGAGGRFVPEPFDAAMQELSDAYIAHYDEPHEWIWCCWVNLTPSGRQFARSTLGGRR